MLQIDQRAHAPFLNRANNQHLRKLQVISGIDFSSNDYLGFSSDRWIREKVFETLDQIKQLGSTGSRLLTGNYPYCEQVERKIAAYFLASGALVFSSGYLLNVGILRTVTSAKDIILMDVACHTSLKNGAKQSSASLYYFKHNNVRHLEKKLTLHKDKKCFIVVESIYSMDGDIADLAKIIKIAKKHNAKVIVDEAHAIGVIGSKGQGLSAHLNLQNDIYARTITFGKALGGSGAALLGSKNLKTLMVNACHEFIYTTAPPIFVWAQIACAIILLERSKDRIEKLKQKQALLGHLLGINIHSPIVPFFIPGHQNVIRAASLIQQNGFKVFPIFSPTVRKGFERIRIVLHAYNKDEDIKNLSTCLKGISL